MWGKIKAVRDLARKISLKNTEILKLLSLEFNAVEF